MCRIRSIYCTALQLRWCKIINNFSHPSLLFLTSDICGQLHVTQQKAAATLTANSTTHSSPSEIKRLWNLKQHFHVHIGSYPASNESRPHIYTYFLKIHFNITIPFTHRSPGQNCVYTFPFNHGHYYATGVIVCNLKRSAVRDIGLLALHMSYWITALPPSAFSDAHGFHASSMITLL